MGVLTGQGAVVTGGSRGIGRAVVERLARDGARVVFGYARDVSAAAQVEEGTGAHGVRADLAEAGAGQELFKPAEEHLDGPDIPVNNAAAGLPPPPPAEGTEDAHDPVVTGHTKAGVPAPRDPV